MLVTQDAQVMFSPPLRLSRLFSVDGQRPERSHAHWEKGAVHGSHVRGTSFLTDQPARLSPEKRYQTSRKKNQTLETGASSPRGSQGPLSASYKVSVCRALMVSRWPVTAGPALPDTPPGSPPPLVCRLPEAPPPARSPAALGAEAPGPGAARPDLDLGRAGPTGSSHPAGAGPGPRAPPSISPRPGAGCGLPSLPAAARPAGGHGGGRRGQAGGALAEGAGGAAERRAAAAAGGASLQRRGHLAARAAAADLLDLAAPVGPVVGSPQHHHSAGPRRQPPHHARAHLLLPRGH